MVRRIPRILASARISVAGVGGSGLTMRQREHRLDHSGSSFRALFMISKPKQRLLLRGESPLSDTAARYGQQEAVMDALDNRGGRTLCILRSRC
jgi:hypothetical protein